MPSLASHLDRFAVEDTRGVGLRVSENPFRRGQVDSGLAIDDALEGVKQIGCLVLDMVEDLVAGGLQRSDSAPGDTQEDVLPIDLGEDYPFGGTGFSWAVEDGLSSADPEDSGDDTGGVSAHSLCLRIASFG